ncbi:UDP-N-acetylmuramoyl-L-alanyl-D-glutamate--2,6-diaminopimelate ligase [Propionicicella superfundia]|uniref:UDP-N-acetylmuramoyl-L-alanyl-D-glutamate--2, 6-diaminopimelate ligase n=1 Tax=Propionicicella superfundia TaxID=348582 RepID=UPI0004149E37
MALSLLGVDHPGRVTGVTLDSRAVAPGDLYVALPGSRTHGAGFAAQAVAAGAVAILTDPAGAPAGTATGVPVVVVDDPRAVMGRIAADVYGRPGDRLFLYGVTGTNGKTSTAILVQAGLAAADVPAASIGTLGFRVRGEQLETGRTTITTPEAPDLQALLALMVERGVAAVAMEVSSHALAQDRVAELTFDVAAFTMLGRDHLEYHHTMEAYFAAKERLFLDGRSRVQVVSVDDRWGRRLADAVRGQGRRPVTTGFSIDADYRIVAWAADDESGGTRARLATPRGTLSLALALPGEFNVRNAVTAIAMLDAGGVDIAAALPGVSTAQIPGRMQRVELPGAAPRVVVDFAHTPEAVDAALRSLPGRIVAVVGSGGDRDPAKRAPIGAAAARHAAVVVVTDDNPRTEDPALIRAAVAAGAREEAAGQPRHVDVVEQGGRRDAIALALDRARPGDWVAILGKGHEQGQTIGTDVIPFDDVTVVRAVWDGRADGSDHAE